MTKSRSPIPDEDAAALMFASDRTCCVCSERGKSVQIHHIDENPSNHTKENRALLCLECHNDTQISGGFGRKLTPAVVIEFRDRWHARVVQRRDEADRIAILRSVGTRSHTYTQSASPIETPDNRSDIILKYVESLPALRNSLREKVADAWNNDGTAGLVQASNEFIDVLQAVLVRMAKFYPKGTFGESDPHEFFSEMLASRFRWHRLHAEPEGPGTAGTIVNVICTKHAVKEVERMVEDMAGSIIGYDDRFDWRSWEKRWREE